MEQPIATKGKITELKHKDGTPEIGTAWLILSHAAFLTAQIGSSAIGLSFFAFFTSSPFLNSLRNLSIGWICVSLFIGFWTAYAIWNTWVAAKKMKNRIFSDFGFVFLLLVNFYIMATSVWSLVVVTTI